MSDAQALEPVFAVCIDDQGVPVSLDVHRIYRILPDERAGQDDYVRVIDNSGEDYLFHRSAFVVIDVPDVVRDSLLKPPPPEPAPAPRPARPRRPRVNAGKGTPSS